jgi:hypothetical protein
MSGDTRQNSALPSARSRTLDKVHFKIKNFTECQIVNTR